MSERGEKRFPYDLFKFLLVTAIGFALQTPCLADTKDSALPAVGAVVDSLCPLSKAEESDGHRRLALIVGVGDYKAKNIKDLKGPPNDAQRIYALLTGKNGYGFPKENVCLLVNEQATLKGFRKAFQEGLIGRARKGDVAVFFFAGHGSQCKDRNGDEPDERDETLMLHDARYADIKDLSDDELNQLLIQLHERTKHVAVILDSCNSGTATRGVDDSYVARWQEPGDCTQVDVDEGTGDGAEDWTSESLSGLVTFTAASDGNNALEKNGRGVFTDAVLNVLAQVGQQPLTYSQAARQIPPLVASKSYQIPYFQGDLGGYVFGNTTREQPLAWNVTSIDNSSDPTLLALAGPPLPGIGKGAEFRLYSGSVSGADTSDPSKAKATVVVDKSTELNAITRIVAGGSDDTPVQLGDFAVLVRPGDEYNKIKVRLRSETEPGGLPKEAATNIRDAVKQHAEANLLIEFTNGNGDFEVSVNAGGYPVLRGPENKIRNTFKKPTEREQSAAITKTLWHLARQKALLQLKGEGGSDFTDGETLQVRLVSADKQTPCADGVWVQKNWNEEQVVPFCHRYHVEVKLSAAARMPLLVGGVVLSTDGTLIGFPAPQGFEKLNPGEKHRFKEKFQGGLPLDVQDRVIVFGTQETNQVAWHRLTATSRTRSAVAGSMGTLYRALDRYLKPGTRGSALVDDELEDTTWTLTSMAIRVEANLKFLRPVRVQQEIDSREYTIANFDIRPYLPDDDKTALHKVLTKADELVRSSVSDGFSYKQHAWNQPSDEDNLRLGIDCSRSIWYAFTRAGLPYNSKEGYLTTAQMVTADTLMNDEFDSCLGDSQHQLGDILVYRDATRGDGHTVLVIDPRKRIAWGSHGWDGNATALKVEPDTGVEYQLIKYKKDWGRWDRKTMQLKACWRYRRFTEEAKTPRGQPGVKSLENACEPKLCRLQSTQREIEEAIKVVEN